MNYIEDYIRRDNGKEYILGYCEECTRFVDGLLQKSKRIDFVNDKEIEYDVYVCKCSVCRNYVNNGIINKYNYDNMVDKYREINGIISKKDVQKLIRYGLNPISLSLILWCDKITYVMYYNGEIPSLNESEFMKDILNNPCMFREFLIENKDYIKEDEFNKSLNIVNSMLDKKVYKKSL